MFVNVIKNRIVRWVIYAVLGTLCLYIITVLPALLRCIRPVNSHTCYRGQSGLISWATT